MWVTHRALIITPPPNAACVQRTQGTAVKSGPQAGTADLAGNQAPSPAPQAASSWEHCAASSFPEKQAFMSQAMALPRKEDALRASY